MQVEATSATKMTYSAVFTGWYLQECHVAGAVGAAALAGVLIHVEPAVAKGLLKHVCIVLAEHRECFERSLLGLFKGDFNVRVRDDRGVDIVHVQLVNA